MLKRIPQALWGPLWLLLVGALLLAMYFILFTREYESVDRGFSKAARSNPYLAAQQYTRSKIHHTWRSHQPLRHRAGNQFSWRGQTLGPGDSLIVINGYGSFSQAEADNLIAWVDQGGHLIYHLDNPFVDLERIELDPILRLLGLDLVKGDAALFSPDEESDELAEEPTNYLPDETEAAAKEEVEQAVEAEAENAAQEEAPEAAAANSQQTAPRQRNSKDGQSAHPPYYALNRSVSRPCFQTPNTLMIPLPDQPRELVVDLGPGRKLDLSEAGTQPSWQAVPGSITPAAAFALGAGQVTLLSNLSAWDNKRLHCGDHGHFLSSVLGPGQQVAWLTNLDAPSLWQRLWNLAPEAVLASLLALAAWLWQANVRFGERIEDRTQQRRVFLEHFKAWANYIWRQPLMAAQIAALRQDCLNRAARRSPGFKQLPIEGQIERLEQLTGLAAPLLQLALTRPVEHQALIVTDIIVALQQLRNHL